MRPGLAAWSIAIGALCFCAPAGAAPFGIQLGPDRLVLDTPFGFSDTAGFGSPRLTEIAETLGDASNRVLVLALSDADTRRFAAGDTPELRRYLLAVTPRVRERDRTTPAQFAALVAETERNFGAAPDASTDFLKYLQGRPPGPAYLLAQLRREPHVLSLLLGTMVPQPPARFWASEKPPVFKLSTTTLALIGGKTLYLSAFSTYDTPADVAWITSITERWVEDLQRLNK